MLTSLCVHGNLLQQFAFIKLCPSNTIDRASTVLGKSKFRCEVMIWRALKCHSHSSEDAGITSSLLIYFLQPKTVCLIVANNESCLNYMLPVNMQVGHGWKCIWPIQKTDPFDPLTHDPSTDCLLWWGRYLQYLTVDRRHVQHSIMMNVTWQRFDLIIVVWPTTSCFADWSKRLHVTLITIEWSTCHGRPCVIIMINGCFP